MPKGSKKPYKRVPAVGTKKGAARNKKKYEAAKVTNSGSKSVYGVRDARTKATTKRTAMKGNTAGQRANVTAQGRYQDYYDSKNNTPGFRGVKAIKGQKVNRTSRKAPSLPRRTKVR